MISCKKLNKNDTQTLTLPLLENISDNLDLNIVFDEFEYVTLESTDQSLFGYLDKLIVDDNFFFILDKAKTKKIFVFSKDGAFIRTIGKVGKGPGEYTNIEDFTIDELTHDIIVLTFPSTVITYNYQGEFISQKKLTSNSLLWNICSYKDGYVCSTNHQSILKGDEAFLIFNFDKDFNLRGKLLDVLPLYIPIPPFISNPLLNVKDEIVYFDAFTSNVHFNVNHKNLKTIHLDFGGKEVPFSTYADAGEFFTKQQEYCFLLESFIADNLLFIAFANCGTRYASIINLETNKAISSENFTWFPDKILYHKDNYFYSSSSALSIIDNDDITYKKKIRNYPLEYNSNPVVVRFKAKTFQ